MNFYINKQRYIDDIEKFNKKIDSKVQDGEIHLAREICLEFLRYLLRLEKKIFKLENTNYVLGIGYFDLGSSFRAIADKANAELSYEKSISFLGKLKNSVKYAEFSHTQIAACNNQLGLLYMAHGPTNLAIERLDATIQCRKELVKKYPKNYENKIFLGGALCNRAHIEREAGKIEESVELYKSSISVLLDTIPPCSCGCRDALASVLSNTMGHPHWILLAHTFLVNANNGLTMVREKRMPNQFFHFRLVAAAQLLASEE